MASCTIECRHVLVLGLCLYYYGVRSTMPPHSLDRSCLSFGSPMSLHVLGTKRTGDRASVSAHQTIKTAGIDCQLMSASNLVPPQKPAESRNRWLQIIPPWGSSRVPTSQLVCSGRNARQITAWALAGRADSVWTLVSQPPSSNIDIGTRHFKKSPLSPLSSPAG